MKAPTLFLSVRAGWLALLLSACAYAAPAFEAPAFIQQLAAGHKQTIVAYGTSLTAAGPWVKMLQDRLNRSFPGLATIVNSGGSGMCSIWGLENLEKKVIDKKPDMVLIEFATNDAATKFNLDTAGSRKNLETMIDAIQRKLPRCEIVLMTMNETTGKPAETRAHRSNEYFQACRAVAKDRNLRLLDHYPHWKAILDADPKKYAAWVPDGSHPSAEACHEIMLPEFERAFFGDSKK